MAYNGSGRQKGRRKEEGNGGRKERRKGKEIGKEGREEAALGGSMVSGFADKFV